MNRINKTLDLVLKHKWYDMIACGEKKEEYREPRYYWYRRLLNVDREGYGYFCNSCEGDFEDLFRESEDSFAKFTEKLKDAIKRGVFEYKNFTHVRFHKGYTSTTMTFEIESITIGKGREEWGAVPGKDYFVIKLQSILNETTPRL